MANDLTEDIKKLLSCIGSMQPGDKLDESKNPMLEDLCDRGLITMSRNSLDHSMFVQITLTDRGRKVLSLPEG